MKLTEAQIETLKKVAEGGVTLHFPVKNEPVDGARKDVVESLVRRALIDKPRAYTLTAYGKIVLEELLKGKE